MSYSLVFAWGFGISLLLYFVSWGLGFCFRIGEASPESTFSDDEQPITLQGQGGLIKPTLEVKMFGFLKKVGQAAKSAVVGVSKKVAAFAVIAGVALCGADVMAEDVAKDIVTYSETGGITWDFSSVLSIMFTALTAAMSAGVLIWVAIKGYQLMKRFLSGR